MTDDGAAAASDRAIEEAARQLRAPGAAGVAGLLFAVSFAAALVLLRDQPVITASDAEIAGLYASGAETPALLAGLYLAPFAGIMFLWFMAVVRDRVGQLEDRFFATVFLASGILFVSLFFVAAALSFALTVGVRSLGQPFPTRPTVDLVRAVAYTILFSFGTRAGAVFLIATASLGRRTRVLPRSIVLLGYALGILLFVVVGFWDWIVLVVPAWVAIVSVWALWSRRDAAGRT